ncbi:MAG TPA: pyrroloquinoline quinone biosynthesis peptide chaperone PqqD [Solirubrobacteraceae bacterium]|nr:pyrroloquinoline quinone biosynthesis peptide chaperone PqqD [Solirubrobacteraceae bacterium]
MSTGPEIVLEERLRRQEGVLAQQAHGRTVLLRLEDGGYYALDEVGAMIWELCDGSRAVAEIVALLCEQFDAPESTVQEDVLEFIGDLRREQLLVVDAA